MTEGYKYGKLKAIIILFLYTSHIVRELFKHISLIRVLEFIDECIPLSIFPELTNIPDIVITSPKEEIKESDRNTNVSTLPLSQCGEPTSKIISNKVNSS